KFELHVGMIQRKRMTQRNELGGAFGRHNSGKPRRLERVAFRRAMRANRLDCGRGHSHESACDGRSRSDVLIANVHHSRAAFFVGVSESHIFSSCSITSTSSP